ELTDPLDERVDPLRQPLEPAGDPLRSIARRDLVEEVAKPGAERVDDLGGGREPGREQAGERLDDVRAEPGERRTEPAPCARQGLAQRGHVARHRDGGAGDTVAALEDASGERVERLTRRYRTRRDHVLHLVAGQ